jgi:5'-AMP-activated protein kinase catalytic alpha subunit
LQRITAAQIHKNDWFKKGYTPATFDKDVNVNLDDIDAVFSESNEHMVTEERDAKPVAMNAFELISLSRGLNLSGLFETRGQEPGPGKETRFTSTKPAKEIITSIEEAAKPLGFNVQKRDYKMKLQGDKHGRKGHLSVATEVFEVAPSLFMVELRKKGGDTLEYHTVSSYA